MSSNYFALKILSLLWIGLLPLAKVQANTQEDLAHARAVANHAISSANESWTSPWKILGFTEKPTHEEFLGAYRKSVVLLHPDRWSGAGIAISDEDGDLFVKGFIAIIEAKDRLNPISLDAPVDWQILKPDEMPPYTHAYEDKLALYFFGLNEDGRTSTLIRVKSQRRVPFKTTMRYQMILTKVELMRLLAGLTGRAYTPDEKLEALLAMGDTLILDISHTEIMDAHSNSFALTQQFLKMVRGEREGAPTPACPALLLDTTSL